MNYVFTWNARIIFGGNRAYIEKIKDSVVWDVADASRLEKSAAMLSIEARRLRNLACTISYSWPRGLLFTSHASARNILFFLFFFSCPGHILGLDPCLQSWSSFGIGSIEHD